MLIRLVNCLFTAKKLFNQSYLHNFMSELDNVTQQKLLKRCSAASSGLEPESNQPLQIAHRSLPNSIRISLQLFELSC